MAFYVEAACFSSVGNVRKNNEDNFVFETNSLGDFELGLKEPLYINKTCAKDFCVAVLDGMGGENFGEVASYAVVEKLKTEKTRFVKSNYINAELEKYITVLNDEVIKRQKEFLTEKMGTTFVSLCCLGDFVKICNIGDSRLYLFRDGDLTQLSIDHIEKNLGDLNKKGGLTQYLGFNTEEVDLDPYIDAKPLKNDDVFLLCTDGLTDLLTDDKILKILSDTVDVKKSVEELVFAAKNNGGSDNITVIICKFIESGE